MIDMRRAGVRADTIVVVGVPIIATASGNVTRIAIVSVVVVEDEWSRSLAIKTLSGCGEGVLSICGRLQQPLVHLPGLINYHRNKIYIWCVEVVK